MNKSLTIKQQELVGLLNEYVIEMQSLQQSRLELSTKAIAIEEESLIVRQEIDKVKAQLKETGITPESNPELFNI